MAGLQAPNLEALTPTDDGAPSTTSTVVAPLGDKHTHTVIFLHGRDDFGKDLAKYFFDSTASDNRTLAQIFPSVKWVFPTSKLRYSARRDAEFNSSSFAEALKEQEIISQWFDMWDIETPDKRQELMVDGLRESMAQILDIIQEEAQLVPLKHIVLGGISQGCATAILTLLWSSLDLGSFIGICSWLPFQNIIMDIASDYAKNKEDISQHVRAIFQTPHSNGSTLVATPTSSGPDIKTDAKDPIGELHTALSDLSLKEDITIKTHVFLAHSKDDEIVPFASHGHGLYKTIDDLGFQVTWKEYEDGGHWIHPRHGVDDIAAFLQSTMEI